MNAATTMPLIQPTGPGNNSTLNIAGPERNYGHSR